MWCVRLLNEGQMSDAVVVLQLPLPWHASVLQELVRDLDQQRLPHALILACHSGWGHRELLLSAAASLMSVDVDEHSIETFAHQTFGLLSPTGP